MEEISKEKQRVNKLLEYDRIKLYPTWDSQYHLRGEKNWKGLYVPRIDIVCKDDLEWRRLIYDIESLEKANDIFTNTE